MAKYLRTRDVAKRLGVSMRRVHQYVEAGRLRPILPPERGQSMVFTQEEVERFERERQRGKGTGKHDV